jgi:hypothetical protein
MPGQSCRCRFSYYLQVGTSLDLVKQSSCSVGLVRYMELRLKLSLSFPVWHMHVRSDQIPSLQEPTLMYVDHISWK